MQLVVKIMIFVIWFYDIYGIRVHAVTWIIVLPLLFFQILRIPAFLSYLTWQSRCNWWLIMSRDNIQSKYLTRDINTYRDIFQQTFWYSFRVYFAKISRRRKLHYTKNLRENDCNIFTYKDISILHLNTR